MTITLLTIGDEICIGQIVNTNAAWMAEQCSLRGWDVLAHSTVRDDLAAITEEMQRLLSFSDVLLMTGGLGPTHDDITKEALCLYFHDHPVLHEDAFVHLKSLLESRGREVTERQKTQAMLPSRCIPLMNTKGTAPGMLFHTNDGRIVISMPGVPFEMRFLMETYVIPLLADRNQTQTRVTLYRTLMTTGIIEASLADLIGDPEGFLDGQKLAFLPSAGGVRLRISVTAEERQEAEHILQRIETVLRKKAGRYIYGMEEDTLASVVGTLLKQQSKTIAVAESCTAGLLGVALTDVPGSSAYFPGGIQAYSNEAKMKFLHVLPETLTTFGAVSKETAEQLAQNVREEFTADIGVSITGIAGPDGGSPEKPVGTIWIGIASAQGVKAEKFLFGTDRIINRERAVTTALWQVYNLLKEDHEQQ